MWVSISLTIIPAIAIALGRLACKIRQERLQANEEEDLDKAYFAPQPLSRQQYGE